MAATSEEKGKGKTIAVTGKGGSGKTAITAIMTGLLARKGTQSILAIDADSSVSLSYALGIGIKKTVAEIRRDVIEDPQARKDIESRHIRNVMEDILEAGEGFQLLTMGRPEGPGCFCATNDLLRYGIDQLSKQYNINLIDCEAGPEQVNRRVVNGVDLLVIVTDNSTRGMHAARSIVEVVRSDRNMKIEKMGLIINRSRGENDLITKMTQEINLDILGVVPNDDALAEYDSLGQPIINLPDNSPSVAAIQEIVRNTSLG